MSKKVRELEELILTHKQKYYSGKATISDEKYDSLEDELRKICPESPVLRMIGTNELDKAVKIPHETKMLSLDKTYSVEDLKKWLGQHKAIGIFKIDGSSCSLLYKNGELTIGKTRGDGKFGEDVTSKIIFIKDIPRHIESKDSFEVRGEVYCDQENFSNLVEDMERLGLEKPTSLRNIVAGILGRKENIQLAKHLSFQAFDLIGEFGFQRETEKIQRLSKMGFKTPEIIDVDDVESILEETKKFMENGSYLIDGLVFVYDQISLQNQLGYTSHHPKFKLAFKFQGETKNTVIHSITWGVSRNGVLTPVAEVEPVELSGATISRVTLHNMGLVKNFELKSGDEIEIVRSGEVIPKFLRVIKSSQQKFKLPKVCPCCSSELVLEDIWLRCENQSCPEKIKEEILYYIQKTNIEDVSFKRLEEMIDKKIISSIPDLYKLVQKDLLKLDKVKEKLAEKIYQNIQKTNEQDLLQFLTALGIDGISQTKAEKIIEAGYFTIDAILAMTHDDLIRIDGFAEKSANDFIVSVKSKKSLISELQKAGVKIKKAKSIKVSSLLHDKKFCITGELSRPRSEIEKLIKSFGGAIVGSVSKNTSYLITNETSSESSKFVKARELKIPIISEEVFLKMLEE